MFKDEVLLLIFLNIVILDIDGLKYFIGLWNVNLEFVLIFGCI